MGFQVDLIRGAFMVVGIAFFGALYQTVPWFTEFVNGFFGGVPNFYQWAIIYSVISVGGYIFASIIAVSIQREEEEE